MQIRELVLYGYNGKVRHLPFALGQVNIITGRSKSGKSVVGDIIDYCLGGDSCNIADGVVRDNVAWYGLLLQFEHERVFVALFVSNAAFSLDGNENNEGVEF